MGRRRKPKSDTVTDRLHGIVARGLVHGLDREEVVRRYREQYGGPWQRRRLGRMLAARQATCERVCLVSPPMFRGMAFIQVKLDLGSLRSDRERVRAGDVSRRRAICRHEDVIEEIVDKTRQWDAQADNGAGGTLPVVALADAFITHGIFEGILLQCYYRDQPTLVEYVTDVVEQVDHVERAQTSFVAWCLTRERLRMQQTGAVTV